MVAVFPGTEDTLADHVTITEDEADELRKAGAILLDDEDSEPPFDVDESDDLDDMADENGWKWHGKIKTPYEIEELYGNVLEDYFTMELK